MKKRILSIILAVSLVFSLAATLSVTVSAGMFQIGDWEVGEFDDGTISIMGYTGNATKLDIPSEIDGKTVVKISDDAGAGYGGVFDNRSSLTSVTIPNSVKMICWAAFMDCTSLTSIIIPDSVISIGDYAFSGCEALTSITIPEGVTKIGDGAFKYCTSLTSINVSVDNKNYSSQDGVLFNKEKTELIQYPIGKEDKEYTIPNSVTSVGDYAFKYCTSLTNITIPDSVTSIGHSAFASCSSLTSVTIPDSVTSIDDYAFDDCTSLTSITIPDSVTFISNGAFENCTSLTNITIPDSITSIGDYAFGYYYDENWDIQKLSNFHIKCYSGTAGEKYAIDNGFDYTLLDSINVNPGDYGDANGDGKITANDVLLIRKSIAGQGVSLNNSAADVNADGKITATDVLMIRKSIAGQNVHFGK